MLKKIALYARCSTVDQNIQMQLADLRRYAEQRGFEIVAEHLDEGVSGTRDSRPALNRLMDEAQKRKFDAVLVWRFDRFARSTRHLLTALQEFRRLGVDFISYQENIDTSSALGEAIFTIVAAVGQLERDIIVQRVRSGLANAKRLGKRLGRPKSRNDDAIHELRAKGFSLRRIAKETGTSLAGVQRALAVSKSVAKAG